MASAASFSRRLVKNASVPITRPPARSWASLAGTASKSGSVLAFSTWSSSERLRAAASASLIAVVVRFGLVGLTIKATDLAPGMTSCISSTRFVTNFVIQSGYAGEIAFRPVHVATIQARSGRYLLQKTIGIVEVAAFAARRCRSAAGRRNHIYPTTNQICGECRQSIIVALGRGSRLPRFGSRCSPFRSGPDGTHAYGSPKGQAIRCRAIQYVALTAAARCREAGSA
jgi:hypothetical protein